MATRDEWLAQLRREVAPKLKGLGFKGTAPTWRRHVGQAIQVVNFQVSQWDARFTVNLGVYWAMIPDVITCKVTGSPNTDDCHVQERLGVLLTGQDAWWTLSESSGVAPALFDQGMEWLNRLSRPEVYITALEKSDKDVHPIIGKQSVPWHTLLGFLRTLTGDVEAARWHVEELRRAGATELAERLALYLQNFGQ